MTSIRIQRRSQVERITNPITETLNIVKERKKVALPVLAYRLGLSQGQVLDILKFLEREKAIALTEEEGEWVVRISDLD